MSEGKFEKVQHSDTHLYGPRKLLLCGFSAVVQSKVTAVLNAAGLDDIAVVWANSEHAGQSLADLFQLPSDSGTGTDSTLPRAIIVGGITENQLHGLMAACRKSGMQQALWAVLTPSSEKWPLEQLLAELQDEHKALARQKRTSQ